MANLNTASTIKGDSKPKIDVDESKIDPLPNAGDDGDHTSSIGEKNVSDNAKGGGDGSLPGAAPNTFIDAREREGYIRDADEA